MKSFALAAAAAAISAAGSVSAATVSFNEARGWTTGAHVYGSGANAVSVEAFLYDNAPFPTPSGNPSLASWSGADGGLGICSGTLDQGSCTGDSPQVDGDVENEMAVLTFGKRVRLTAITFAPFDSVETDPAKRDKFDVFTFGNGAGAASTQSFLERTVLCPGGVCTVQVGPFDLTGTVFGIGAFQDGSAFKIQSVSFEDAPLEVIPLPAAGWGLVAGLGALAMLRRRRKAA
jgi:hypothetical protein